MELSGKVAIVTGGASGIGQAIAVAMARAGAMIAIDYVGGPETPRQTVEQVEGAGGKCITVEADVSQPEEVTMLVRSTVDAFGRLDILINNAGIEKEMPFWDIPIDFWRKTIAVNLSGPFFCAQAAARQMMSRGGGGRIINISSVHEDMPMPTNAAYCATKGGLRMLMRTLAVELAPHGITVNNIGPGAIDTPLDKATKDDPQKLGKLLAEIPLGRMGQPEEVAALAVFLASGAGAYITGSTYFIDGGMLRQSGSL